jgi:hypothetical protein
VIRRVFVAAAVCALSFVSARAGGLAIVGTELRDNGDHDGYADTNETVEVWLTVRNTTAQPLTGVTVQVSTSSVGLVCLVDATASIGNLAPGAEVRAIEPFVFHVEGSLDRTARGLTPFGDLRAAFDVAFTASPTSPAAYPPELVMDLDLDVAGGNAPTTLTEDFESGGFGLFTIQNLDFGRHDDTNGEFGLANGWRCQYHEPYCDHAVCEGTGFNDCSPGGTAAAANAVWWRIDGPSVPGGGRGYSGTHSLYFGEPLGAALGYTTPLGALEAVATTSPVHLGRGSWCSNAPATSCVNDGGCPPGGSCTPVIPTLSFKHQVSFMDNRTVDNVPPDLGQALDRGVVAIQLADPSTGAPAGPWVRVEPSVNVHDTVAAAYFVNCTFDPIDDGSDGDDLDPPHTIADGVLRRGPSSTCADEGVFASMGSTQGPFNAAAVGRADGPGLAGFSGPGTWVQTQYDLSRYRGRSVRIRFLATTTRLGTNTTWQQGFALNPHPGDDGWWIDDITMSGASAAPSAVTNDAHDNSGLTLDADLDGADDHCDDNCVGVANPSQSDLDADGAGDACDGCTDVDADGFGHPGLPASTCPVDNCPLLSNPGQTDSDLDGEGDPCDACPSVPDTDVDSDSDGAGDVCDCSPSDPNTYPRAPEINDGLDNQCPGDEGSGMQDEIATLDVQVSALTWTPQPFATNYRVAMLTGIRYGSATCTGTLSTSDPFWQGSGGSNPPLGRTTYFIVHAQAPHAGSWGRASSGVERTGLCGLPP